MFWNDELVLQSWTPDTGAVTVLRNTFSISQMLLHFLSGFPPSHELVIISTVIIVNNWVLTGCFCWNMYIRCLSCQTGGMKDISGSFCYLTSCSEMEEFKITIFVYGSMCQKLGSGSTGVAYSCFTCVTWGLLRSLGWLGRLALSHLKVSHLPGGQLRLLPVNAGL